MKDSNSLRDAKYEFGTFRLDVVERRLESNGACIALTPKALDLLAVLVANRGHLLTKAELLDHVWAGSHVEESTLVQNIATLRRALGGRSAGETFIETVPKVGYRFVADVKPVPDRDAFVPAEEAASFHAGAKLEKSVRPNFVAPNWRTVVLLPAIAALSLGWIRLARQQHQPGASVSPDLKQLTAFPDSVHFPALSRDGKMLLFIRGGGGFGSGGGEVYLKLLPDGQPFALTHDGLIKMAPTFSPDGSHVIYTVPSQNWSSFSVPVTGGEPKLFMPNAAGLTWVGPHRVLFSEIRDAPHMAVATANESRAQERDVYVPQSHQGMAHFAYLSPDRKAVLVLEMTTDAGWLPCRIVPFDHSSRGMQIGPPGSKCTAAAWNPDGHSVYFIAEVGGESHLWRQEYPNGRAEQLTFGFNQEKDVAVEPDGHSVITSVGTGQSSVWYHDSGGDRPISGEGYAYRPQVSGDGTKVFYLVRRAAQSGGELWSTDLGSGRSERVLPDFLVRYFHVAQDGKHVVFDSVDTTGRSRVWIAPTDRSEPPRRLTPDGAEEQRAFFGESGTIYFMREESTDLRFIYRMNADGSNRHKISGPITFLVNISPDERWAAVWNVGATYMLPLAGGRSRTLCDCGTGPIYPDSPRINWSSDRKFLLVAEDSIGATRGATRFIPWNGAPVGIAHNGRVVRETSVSPGPSLTTYAFTRRAEQRNLFRVRIP